MTIIHDRSTHSMSKYGYDHVKACTASDRDCVLIHVRVIE